MHLVAVQFLGPLTTARFRCVYVKLLLESDVKYSMCENTMIAYVIYFHRTADREQRKATGKSASSLRSATSSSPSPVVIHFFSQAARQTHGQRCHLLAAGCDVYVLRIVIVFARAGSSRAYRVNKRASILLKRHLNSFEPNFF